jgi:hypothetical protein
MSRTDNGITVLTRYSERRLVASCFGCRPCRVRLHRLRIGRLAVDRQVQGQGIGQVAFLRTYRAGFLWQLALRSCRRCKDEKVAGFIANRVCRHAGQCFVLLMPIASLIKACDS